MKGCDDCPLAEHEWSHCQHPTAEVPEPEGDRYGHGLPDAGAPSWCPLRTAPLTIALEPLPQAGVRRIVIARHLANRARHEAR